MKAKIITGQYIKEPSTQKKFKESLEQKPGFNLLLNHFAASTNDLTLSLAYEFDGFTDENELVLGKTAKLKNTENTIQLDYFQKIFGNDVVETFRVR